MSKLPPKGSKAINALKKYKHTVDEFRRIKRERRGQAPQIKITNENKQVLDKTLTMLMNNSLDIEHNISFGSLRGSGSNLSLGDKSSSSLGDSREFDRNLRRFEKKRMRKYTYDATYNHHYEPDPDEKIQKFKERRAARVISEGMLKFALALKERRQVQLRIFAKHHMRHVRVIERAFLKFLKKKHQAPIEEIYAMLQTLYQKVFIKA